MSRDELAAKYVLGWQYMPQSLFRPRGWRRPDSVVVYLPRFGEDCAATRLLEDAIERRNLKARYIRCLLEAAGCEVLGGWDAPDSYSMPVEDVWALTRATPAQRRDAALRAVGVEL